MKIAPIPGIKRDLPMRTVGIVGNGVVGNVLGTIFTEHDCEVRLFDRVPDRSPHCLAEVLRCDYVFVCLPTPMASEGRCDTGVVEDFFDRARRHRPTCLFVLKSTVPPGTTKKIQQRHPRLRLLHSPEFLTARNGQTDFLNTSYHVVGGANFVERELLASFLKTITPAAKVFTMSSDESEMVKYLLNSYAAVKAMFFTLAGLASQTIGADFAKVREAVTADRRVGTGYTDFKGDDGMLGFGGNCLPKDICGMMHFLKSIGVPAEQLEATISLNHLLRNPSQENISRVASITFSNKRSGLDAA